LDDVIAKTASTAPPSAGPLEGLVAPAVSTGSSFDPEISADGLAAHGYDRLDGHTEAVWAVALSADARTAVSASLDGTVRVWDVAARRGTRVLDGHSRGVTAVALSPDGRHVVSGSLDGTVRCRDVATGSLIWSDGGGGGPVTAVALAGPKVLVGRDGGAVSELNLGDGRLIRRHPDLGDRIFAIAVAAERRTAAAGGADGRVWEIDLGSGRVVWTHLDPQCGNVRAVAYSGAGPLLAAGAESGRILVRRDPGRAPTQFRGHSDWVRGLTFDGPRLLSVGDDETLETWQPVAGSDFWLPAGGHRSADESLLAVTHAAGVTVIGGESGSVYVRAERSSSADGV
jgi:WD40 repeat protein